METRQIFSRMFVIAKKLKSRLLLLGILASVRCVSSIIVVLNTKFARLLAAHAKKTVRNEEDQQECRVLLVKTH